MSNAHTHSFDEADWPFDEPVSTATFTTRHVMDGSLPVLEVFHDHDGEWQFLCGTTTESADVKLVCMGCVLERDASLFGLADLPPGWCADRAAPGEPWIRDVFAQEDDEEEDDEDEGEEEGVERGEGFTRMSAADFESFVDIAVDELSSKQDALISEHGFGGFARWYFDQASEKLEMFDEEDRKLFEADVIDIGSYSSSSGTWKWAWSNESVLPALREKSAVLKALERTTGRRMFIVPEAFKLDEECMAWELAALCVQQLRAMGVYRAPDSAGRLNNFLAIIAVRPAAAA
ncbi:DUF6882 domain-containing protein [Diaphorobacter caeni]|uniref:DUF6882 domain-containing protein n=1 Tax=Diaphorobacter caeni TaxID=2784387 RepID=UPI00188DCF95|nr:DUF6882 domain-containing protein [Diaphorobacter caeni]MBF5005118.1 hypothetical protein [Diaphorobacter caeni]